MGQGLGEVGSGWEVGGLVTILGLECLVQRSLKIVLDTQGRKEETVVMSWPGFLFWITEDYLLYQEEEP